MQLKQLIAVTYAITAGALAISLTSNYTQLVRNKYAQMPAPVAAAPVSMTTVVTVAKAIPMGHKLSVADFTQISWPADAVPTGAFQNIKEVFATHSSVSARTPLFKGEVMLPGKLRDAADGSVLSSMLPPDMRAVTIKVNEVRGVGGFLRPSDRVDILLTEKSNKQSATAALSTSVLLQNIHILAIGQDMKSDALKAKITSSVTVAVTLQDAQKLALATTIGHLSLALRNPKQNVVAGPRDISLNDLQPEKIARKADTSKIVVFRSTKASDYSVPLSGLRPRD